MAIFANIVFLAIIAIALYSVYLLFKAAFVAHQEPCETNEQPCESCGTPCQSDLAATGGSHLCYNCFMVNERITELEDRVGELTKANKEMATCIKVLFKVYTRPDSYARTMEVHDVPSGKCSAQRLTHEALAHLGPEVACLQPGEEAAIQLQYNGGVYLYHRLAD